MDGHGDMSIEATGEPGSLGGGQYRCTLGPAMVLVDAADTESGRCALWGLRDPARRTHCLADIKLAERIEKTLVDAGLTD